MVTSVPNVLDFAEQLTQVRWFGSYQYIVSVEASTSVDDRSAVSWTGTLNVFADEGAIERSQTIIVESGIVSVTVAMPVKAPGGTFTLNRPARSMPPRSPSILADTRTAVGDAASRLSAGKVLIVSIGAQSSGPSGDRLQPASTRPTPTRIASADALRVPFADALRVPFMLSSSHPDDAPRLGGDNLAMLQRIERAARSRDRTGVDSGVTGSGHGRGAGGWGISRHPAARTSHRRGQTGTAMAARRNARTTGGTPSWMVR